MLESPGRRILLLFRRPLVPMQVPTDVEPRRPPDRPPPSRGAPKVCRIQPLLPLGFALPDTPGRAAFTDGRKDFVGAKLVAYGNRRIGDQLKLSESAKSHVRLINHDASRRVLAFPNGVGTAT